MRKPVWLIRWSDSSPWQGHRPPSDHSSHYVPGETEEKCSHGFSNVRDAHQVLFSCQLQAESLPFRPAETRRSDGHRSYNNKLCEMRHDKLRPAPSHLKSDVWQHFGFSEDTEGVVDKSHTVCKVCSANFKYFGNTTNMKKHITRFHSELEKQHSLPITNTPGYIQRTLDQVAKLPPNSEKAKRITRSVAGFIAKDLRPYSVVENQGFRTMLQNREQIWLQHPGEMKVQLSPQMKGKALIRTEPNLCEGNVRSNRDGQPRCILSDCRQDKGGPESEVRKEEEKKRSLARCWPSFFECDSTMPPTAVTVHFKACAASINNAPGVVVQRVISPSALLRQNNSIRCLICHLTNAPLKGPQLPPTIGSIKTAAWLPASHNVWHGSVTCFCSYLRIVRERFRKTLTIHLSVWRIYFHHLGKRCTDANEHKFKDACFTNTIFFLSTLSGLCRVAATIIITEVKGEEIPSFLSQSERVTSGHYPLPLNSRSLQTTVRALGPDIPQSSRTVPCSRLLVIRLEDTYSNNFDLNSRSSAKENMCVSRDIAVCSNTTIKLNKVKAEQYKWFLTFAKVLVELTLAKYTKGPEVEKQVQLHIFQDVQPPVCGTGSLTRHWVPAARFDEKDARYTGVGSITVVSADHYEETAERQKNARSISQSDEAFIWSHLTVRLMTFYYFFTFRLESLSPKTGYVRRWRKLLRERISQVNVVFDVGKLAQQK
ncbi:hypothetical protein E1301_Tti009072 [Triplophysa tibetana]|uniref:BED-type domain-containing protein n=1 Tax=Triplophysa tibetana TaxID=1572043 RepID=A0A5A9PJB1_9TELE|nr:hypothetical protein E1301_Tti009072 [Triplophysa tibetana]